MCDNLPIYTNFYDGFFNHYLKEHAILMSHFQQIHSSSGSDNYYSNYPNSMYSHCVTGNNSCSSSISGSCSLSNCTSCISTSSCDSSCSCSDTFSEYETEELCMEDEQQYIARDDFGNDVFELEQEYDEDESECEYELNVEALLAFRAATKELKEAEELELKKSSSSSDSLVYVDSDKEEFEFVELGSLNTLQSTACHDVGNRRHRNLEAKTRKEIMNHCYGDQSSKISGQETAMSIDFERLCDAYQPSLWPVLPLRLKFN